MKETIVQILGFLSILIGVVKKFEPGVDDYLKIGAPVLAEIDDIVDAIVVEFPDNEYLHTANEVLDKVLTELEEAGYNLDAKAKKKIANRVKAKVAKSGLDLNLDFKKKSTS
jgi:hypothetical protein